MLTKIPQLINSLRIIPRALIITYLYLLIEVTQWFMTLPEPTNTQAGFISVLVGAGAAWFGLYVNSGNSK